MLVLSAACSASAIFWDEVLLLILHATAQTSIAAPATMSLLPFTVSRTTTTGLSLPLGKFLVTRVFAPAAEKVSLSITAVVDSSISCWHSSSSLHEIYPNLYIKEASSPSGSFQPAPVAALYKPAVKV